MKPTPQDIRRLWDTDLDAECAVPISRLSLQELEWRDAAFAAKELLIAEGWKPNDSLKRGGRNHALSRRGKIVYRWGALSTIYDRLPHRLHIHPYADETIEMLKSKLVEEGIHVSSATVKADLKKLKVRKPKNSG